MFRGHVAPSKSRRSNLQQRATLHSGNKLLRNQSLVSCLTSGVQSRCGPPALSCKEQRIYKNAGITLPASFGLRAIVLDGEVPQTAIFTFPQIQGSTGDLPGAGTFAFSVPGPRDQRGKARLNSRTRPKPWDRGRAKVTLHILPCAARAGKASGIRSIPAIQGAQITSRPHSPAARTAPVARKPR